MICHGIYIYIYIYIYIHKHKNVINKYILKENVHVTTFLQIIWYYSTLHYKALLKLNVQRSGTKMYSVLSKTDECESGKVLLH